VRLAATAGVTDFGENYLKKRLPKWTSWPLNLQWHFIGAIQSNKTRAIRRALRLGAQRGSPECRADCRSKGLFTRRPQCVHPGGAGAGTDQAGVSPDGLPELATAVAELPRLSLRGSCACRRRNYSRTMNAGCSRGCEPRFRSERRRPEARYTVDGHGAEDVESAIAEGANADSNRHGAFRIPLG